MASSVYRVCLCNNLKMQNIENTLFQEFYVKITGTLLSTEDGRPTTICYICNSQLQRCLRFFNMCQKSDKICRDLFHNNLKVTQEILTQHNLGWMNNLSVTNLRTISIIDDKNCDDIEISIKEETEDLFVDDTETYVEDLKKEENCIKKEKEKEKIIDNINDSNSDNQSASSNTSERDVKLEQGKILSEHEVFACEICNQTFSLRKSLQQHIKIHSEVKQHTDDIFNSSFTQGTTLKRQRRRYTGEKPYICNICNKPFKRQSDLKNHMRIHTGEKPYQCEICNRSFSRSGSLSIHMICVHTREKNYTCNICDKSFSSHSNLYAHMRIHKGEKSFTCSICEKSFMVKSYLISHLKVHSGEKPYTCNIHTNIIKAKVCVCVCVSVCPSFTAKRGDELT